MAGRRKMLAARRADKDAEASAVVAAPAPGPPAGNGPAFVFAAAVVALLVAAFLAFLWYRRRRRPAPEPKAEAPKPRLPEKTPEKKSAESLWAQSTGGAATPARSPSRSEAAPAKPELSKQLTPGLRPRKDAPSSEPRPPRPAFVFYGLDMRVYLQQRHPEKSLREIGTALHAMWESLDDEARAPYETKAKNDEARYWREARAREKRKRPAPAPATEKKPPSPNAPGFAASPGSFRPVAPAPPSPAQVAPQSDS